MNRKWILNACGSGRPGCPCPSSAKSAAGPSRFLVGFAARRPRKSPLGLKLDEHFRKACLQPALDAGLVEMAIPYMPCRSRQRYRLIAAGRAPLQEIEEA